MKIRHSSLNRILLLLTGLWPYQRSILTQLQLVLMLGILIIYIMFQSTIFLTTICTLEIILRSIFAMFFFASVMIIYLSFSVNIETLKTLFDEIQRSCDELKDENEIAIIESYWFKSKRYVTGLTIFALCSIFTIILVQYWPLILDVVAPLNKTRPLRQIQMLTGFIGDREKYLYLIMLYANAGLCIGVFAVLGTGTMMLAYFFHICGMFSVARYSDYFMSKFALWFASLIGVGVLSTSFNLLQIFQTISYRYKTEDVTIYLASLSAQYIFMFMANFVAQEVTDHNEYFFATVYNVRWYRTPVHIQKIMLFLLEKGTKPFNLNLGGIFVGSIEGFTTLMSATISYFTVICSVRRSHEDPQI